MKPAAPELTELALAFREEETRIGGHPGGAWARSLCARAAGGRDADPRPGSVCPKFRNPRLCAARRGGSRSALLKIPYINCGQSPKKHSSLLAAAGRSCRAVRAAEGK